MNYQVDKRNLFWPIPNSAITANTGARLRQNYGYDGYDEAIPMFTNWEEAVADEELTNNDSFQQALLILIKQV